MSAENEHTGDGSVETQEDPREETGAESRDGAVAVDDDHLLDLYKKMVLIRVFEEATQRAFRKGKIGGYLHVYTGQEAVATGFIDAYQEGDRVITAYRDHPFPLLLGSDPKEVMAELYGKETGEIIQLYLGDGAMNGGPFLESANLAGLWGKDGMCPCLFIVENNQYGMGTSVARSTAMTDLAAKFDAFGVESEKVDGMDLEAVLEVAHRATEQLLEHKLIERGVIGEDDVEEIRDEMQETINEVTSFADESEEPPLEELYTDVYAGQDEYTGEEE